MYRIKTSSDEHKKALKIKRQESFKAPKGFSGDDLRAILFPRRSKWGKAAESFRSAYKHNGAQVW